MHLVFVDDSSDTLYPFSILHCSWELRCSRDRFVQRWIDLLKPESIDFVADDPLKASFLARFPQYTPSSPRHDRTIVLSGSLVPSAALATHFLSQISRDVLYTRASRIVARSLASDLSTVSTRLTESLLHYSKMQDTSAEDLADGAHLITALWDCLDMIDNSIADDHNGLNIAAAAELVAQGVACVGTHPVYLGEQVVLSPAVVFDTRKGPIVIDDNVTILPQVVLMGPCSIGAHTTIKSGAKIYPSVVIGEWCKVGGEVENSIIHAYSNKQHEGFLGHSFLSEWVNIGADSNTSDLKNTYGPIRMQRRGIAVDTDRIFLGLMCGDHSKCGINTMFNTGTTVGIHANIFGAGYTPAEIASYTWGGVSEMRAFPLKKALSVAKTVMARRNKTLVSAEEELMIRESERRG